MAVYIDIEWVEKEQLFEAVVWPQKYFYCLMFLFCLWSGYAGQAESSDS